MAKKFSYALHQAILTEFYRPGAQVEYPNVPGERQYRGIVECESTVKKGFYLIRNEDTKELDSVYWCYMRLARRHEAHHG